MSLTRPKSRQKDFSSFLETWEEFASKIFSLLKNSVPTQVVPFTIKSARHVEFFMCLKYFCLPPLPFSSAFRASCDDIWLTWIIPDNLPILRSAVVTFIPFCLITTYSSGCYLIIFTVLWIRAWDFFEGHNSSCLTSYQKMYLLFSEDTQLPLMISPSFQLLK